VCPFQLTGFTAVTSTPLRPDTAQAAMAQNAGARGRARPGPEDSAVLGAARMAASAAAAAALARRALAHAVAAAIFPVCRSLARARLVLAFHGRFLPVVSACMPRASRPTGPRRDAPLAGRA
jgi:hypothetical protein